MPGSSMLRSLNVATPLVTGSTSVPDSRAFWNKLPSCASATFTDPVKPGTVLPSSSSTTTCTAGLIVAPGSIVLLGCTRKPTWVAVCGFNATTPANQLLGAWNDQVHCGSRVPAVGATVYAAAALFMVFHTPVIIPKPPGSVRSTTPSDIVTA